MDVPKGNTIVVLDLSSQETELVRTMHKYLVSVIFGMEEKILARSPK